MGAKKSIEQLAETEQTGDLTTTEIEERNETLIRDRLRGQSWPYLATKYKLTSARCQDIFSNWREHNRSTFAGRAPIDLVYRMLDRYEAWVEQLAEVAGETASDSVAISAISQQMAAMQKAAELCQATGILPHNLGMLRLEMDVQVLAAQLIAVLDEHGAPVDLKRAMLAALQPSDALSEPALPSDRD